MERADAVKASKFVHLPEEYQQLLVKSGHVIPVNDKFFEYFGSREEIIFFYGSYGNGKSKFVAQDLVEKCRFDDYFKCFFGRKVKDTVRVSLFDEICTEIEERGMEDEFVYSRADNSSMIITHKKTGNKFIPFGADNSRNLKSIKDATHIVCDEFDQFTEKDYGFLLSRLRTKKAQTQFIAMFNTEPLVQSHWITKSFFNKDKPHDVKMVFGTYKENYFINKEEYDKKLRQIANGREHVYKAIAEGHLGASDNDNPFFYAYSRKKHFTFERYNIDKQQFFDISFDFNKMPCVCVIGQINRLTLRHSTIRVLMATPQTKFGLSSLEALCMLVKEEFIDTGLVVPARIRVTGDAAGNSGSADRQESVTFYTIIMKTLGIYSNQVHIKKTNFLHETSSRVCNYAMTEIPEGFFTLVDVQELEDDMNNAYYDEKNTLNEAKKKLGLHIVDAARYLWELWFCYVNGSWIKDPEDMIRNIDNIKKRIEILNKAA